MPTKRPGKRARKTDDETLLVLDVPSSTSILSPAGRAVLQVAGGLIRNAEKGRTPYGPALRKRLAAKAG